MKDKISRRNFLRLTTAKLAGIAAGAFIGGGLAGYLIGSTNRPATETLTQTIYSTKELTKTLYHTEVQTSVITKPLTITQTKEKTITQTKIEKVTTTFTQPYEREFPNLAKDAKIKIWSFYYPWYSSKENWTKFSIYTPLLGEYDSSSSFIISKHIDWATGYGISAFFISWWGVNKREDINLKRHFLMNELSRDIKFAILYESLKDTPPFNPSRILSDLEYFEHNFFKDERYLKVNGRSALFFYLARAYPEEAKNAMEKVRENYDVYLIGDVVYWQDPRKERELIKAFDAVTAYNMHTSVQSILDKYTSLLDKKYAEWYDVCKEEGVDFIPQVLPGFDDRKYPGRKNLPLPRSLDLFREQFGIAKKYMPLSAIFVTSFNEWYESTHVEPSKEEYFTYLQVIKENLT